MVTAPWWVLITIGCAVHAAGYALAAWRHVRSVKRVTDTMSKSGAQW
jgi:hypothetical protein